MGWATFWAPFSKTHLVTLVLFQVKGAIVVRRRGWGPAQLADAAR
jgi:hypothetical protein